jgi:1,4-alpha-glucan branching enzyme
MAKKFKSKPVAIKHTQVFLCYAPGAQEVKLAGDFTQWQQNPIPMERDSDGTWEATVDLPPGEYNYLFLVDGNWCDDPDSGEHRPNPFGGVNAFRQVV